MISRIYKYPIWSPTQTEFFHCVERASGDIVEIMIPQNARFCHLGNQGDEVVLWFEVMVTEEVLERKRFQVFGTGDDINWDMGVDREFVGTVQMASGLVWHVFEYKGI